MKKQPRLRKLLEWVIPLGLIGMLFATGYWPEVAGSIQSLLVRSGISKPDLQQTSNEAFSYQFDLQTMGGQRIAAESARGKVIFINLWATWCPPCIAEMPDIDKLYEAQKGVGNVEFWMINLDRDQEKAKRFLERKGYSFPVYFPASPLPEALQVKSIPTTLVVDPLGRIRMRHSGMASYNHQAFKTYLRDLWLEYNS